MPYLYRKHVVKRNMKNLGRLRTILDLARNFESQVIDHKLEEGVKKTTKLILTQKPDTTFEELLMNLLLSARESYKRMIDSEEINSTANMFMDLVDMMLENDGDDKLDENESIMLRYILKGQIVTNMLSKSFNVSVKAVNDAWNGMKGTES